jgi:hypothetical protein
MHTSRYRWLPALIALSGVTCAENITQPPAVSQVTLTSNIGSRLAVGRTATLAAVARDASGGEVTNVAVSWSSSATNVATVSPAGVVTGLATGSTTITVSVQGVTATFAFQVSTPDFSGITATLADPFFLTLVPALTPSTRTRMQTAVGLCSTGVSAGDFSVVDGCVRGVRDELAVVTDATDRALLATMILFIDHIDRLLQL